MTTRLFFGALAVALLTTAARRLDETALRIAQAVSKPTEAPRPVVVPRPSVIYEVTPSHTANLYSALFSQGPGRVVRGGDA